ncbi:MAG TPA: hypothetical protein VL916_00565 [Ilumatobacteraceae bacterium]|nr:hypothetical protein [Ilumatobacteraceae bacterium]
MTIAAAAAAAWGVALLATRLPMLRAPAVIALLVLTLGPAANAGEPFVEARMHSGTLDAVHRICRIAGSDGVVAVEPDGLLALTLPQAVRGFCGVPAMGVRRTTPPVGGDVQEWADEGHTLYVVSRSENPAVVPGVETTLIEHLVIDDAHQPVRAIGRRPDTIVPRPVEIWIYRVEAA